MNKTPADVGHNNPPSTIEILTENCSALVQEVKEVIARAKALPSTIKSAPQAENAALVAKDLRAAIKKADTRREQEKKPHLQAGRDVDAFFKGGEFKELADVAMKIKRATDDYVREVERKAREKLAAEQAKRDEDARKAREAADKAEAEGNTVEQAKAEARASNSENLAAATRAKADVSTADLVRQKTGSGVTIGTRTVKKIRITDINALNLGPLAPYLDREHVQQAANNWLKFNKGADPLPGLEVYDDTVASIR